MTLGPHPTGPGHPLLRYQLSLRSHTQAKAKVERHFSAGTLASSISPAKKSMTIDKTTPAYQSSALHLTRTGPPRTEMTPQKGLGPGRSTRNARSAPKHTCPWCPLSGVAHVHKGRRTPRAPRLSNPACTGVAQDQGHSLFPSSGITLF